jgi:hypothetical protein
MFQIEFLVNKSQKPNENITNLIPREYIGSFLFNRRFMQRSKFYIFMIKKISIAKHAIIPIDC